MHSRSACAERVPSQTSAPLMTTAGVARTPCVTARSGCWRTSTSQNSISGWAWRTWAITSRANALARLHLVQPGAVSSSMVIMSASFPPEACPWRLVTA
jgi:hypothetical protein